MAWNAIDGLTTQLDEPSRKRLLETIKRMEHEGYDFEVAEGNFELLVLQQMYPNKDVVRLIGYDVTTKAFGGNRSEDLASIIIEDDGVLRASTGTGQGPDARATPRRCVRALSGDLRHPARMCGNPA